MQRKANVLRLTESAIMVAFASVLSEIQIVNLPQGGSITAFSMLPIVIIAYRYGTRWGLFTGFVYGLFQMMLGMNNLKYGTSALAVIAIVLFDYLIAFTVLGLGGIFRKWIKNQGLALACGSVLVSVLRYACHVVSGLTVWAAFRPDGTTPLVYSLGYNAAYMVPEAIITVVGALLISLVLDFKSADITRRGRRPSEVTFERSNVATATKMTGIAVLVGGILYDIYTVVNIFLASADPEIPKEQVLTVLAVAAVVGVILIAAGEVVQILHDIRLCKCAQPKTTAQLKAAAEEGEQEEK